MPNWCCNQLRVVGPREEVRRFFERASSGNALIVDAIDVAHVIDANNESAIANAVIASHRQEGLFSFGGHCPEPEENEDWYEWRLKNWGSKWDVKDAALTKLTTEDSTWVCHVEFSTPWAPPDAWYCKVVAEHPALDVSLLWNEEQGITGIFVLKDGVPTSEDASYEELAEMGWYGPFDPKMWEELEQEAEPVDDETAEAIAQAQANTASSLSNTVF
jgi:hypothetical protein